MEPQQTRLSDPAVYDGLKDSYYYLELNYNLRRLI
jgi:hypothetical protein